MLESYLGGVPADPVELADFSPGESLQTPPKHFFSPEIALELGIRQPGSSFRNHATAQPTAAQILVGRESI